tara:strand:+ start:369 stop:1421 length:1053 start_codon:yes stop_codon:yes gene_type:complete
MFTWLFLYDIQPGYDPPPETVVRQLEFNTPGKVEASGGASQHIEDWEVGNTIVRDLGYGLTRQAPTYSEDARLGVDVSGKQYRFLQTDSDALCAFATACQVLYSAYYHELNDWGKKMLNAYLVGTNKNTIATSEDMNPHQLDKRPEVMLKYNALFMHASIEEYVPMSCPHILCALFNCTHIDGKSMAFALTHPGAEKDWIDQRLESFTLYLEDTESDKPTLLRSASACGIVPLNLESADIPMQANHIVNLATINPESRPSRAGSLNLLLQNMPRLTFATFTTKVHRATIIRLLNKPDQQGKEWSHFISCVRRPSGDWLWLDPNPEFQGLTDKYASRFKSIQDMYYVFDLS